jgi:S1-C subfamily serine protease
MKKFLILLFSFFFGTLITSCAVQTNVIKSLDTAKKSVLKIETWARQGVCEEENMTCDNFELFSTGSGAVVLHNNKKAVLTAAHVCKQNGSLIFLGEKIEIETYIKAIDRKNKEYIIEIIKHNSEADICLLRSVSGSLEPGYLKLSTKSLEYGEITYNLAGPMGIIDGDMVPVFQGQFFGNLHGNAFYSTPVIGGSSGSPIVNFKGELVGMIHSVHYRFHHIALSATYERLWNFLKIAQNHTSQSQN